MNLVEPFVFKIINIVSIPGGCGEIYLVAFLF